MKKNILLTFLFACAAIFTTKAETFSVTLRIVDMTKGEVTNPGTSDDNIDANIYTWLDDALLPLNPRTPADWWYPMYNDPDVSPKGEMTLTESALVWSLTIQAEPGKYEWSPGAKSADWNDIRNSLFPFEGDEDTNNLIFEVAADGTITGHTELVITEVIEYYSGTMTLAVEVPAGTEEVYVRGLYGDWATPILMNYIDSENAWVYEVEGSRIPKGQVQEYKYYYGEDSWEKIEANEDGSMRGDGDNRELNYIEGDIQWDTVLAWYVGETALEIVKEGKDYTISTGNGSLKITGNVNNVTVYTLTGAVVDAANVNGIYSNAALSGGLYIVKVNGISEKVAVK
ncbi:MAG: hypothetical protein LUG18_02875 [Candidatus Azobacteroides sp.]|nr:hypothetical protein [Candidatus Azobacteroides sp.]